VTGADRTRRVLGAIDATVDGRCACGCGMLLRASSPSGWFATDECQRLYHARTATRPLEVWSRPDAAVVLPEQDHVPVPLRDESAARAELAQLLALERHRRELEYLQYVLDTRFPTVLVERPLPDPGPAYTTSSRDPSPMPPARDSDGVIPAGLRYRRRCASCRAAHPPIFGNTFVYGQTGWLGGYTGPTVPSYDDIRTVHLCGNCHAPYPAPALWSRVGRDGPGFRLGLTDEPNGTTMMAIYVTPDAARYPEMIEVKWRDLERAVEAGRPPLCVHPECLIKARSRFVVSGRLSLPLWGRYWESDAVLDLCSKHRYEVLRDPYLVGGLLWPMSR